jgi:preprotein translocase subunit SecE
MATRTTERTTSNEQRDTSRRSAQRGGSAPPSAPSRLRAAFRDTMSEIRKVSWPTTETTRNLTLLVIAMATVLGALLGGIDAIFVRIWECIPSV